MCFNMDHCLIPCRQSQKHYGNVNGTRVQDEYPLSNFLNSDGFSPSAHRRLRILTALVSHLLYGAIRFSLKWRRLVRSCARRDFCFTLKLIPRSSEERSTRGRVEQGGGTDGPINCNAPTEKHSEAGGSMPEKRPRAKYNKRGGGEASCRLGRSERTTWSVRWD